jgi:hypothetical protein
MSDKPKTIIPSELSPDEQYRRNGEYVSLYDYEQLQAENKHYIEALKFYADGENYQEHTTHHGEPLGTTNVTDDHGERARQALLLGTLLHLKIYGM